MAAVSEALKRVSEYLLIKTGYIYHIRI
jgi:hypothetical protein